MTSLSSVTSRFAPRRVILELDLTSSPLETEPDDPIGKLRARQKARLRPLLRALHEAGDDPRVLGVVARVGRGALSWTTMQELREAVHHFRRSGKPTVVWAETFGEGGNGTIDYVLASAFERIWLGPTGELALMGVASETTFLRGALDKLGVEPQLHQRKEYKNAADRIMRTGFTPEHEESLRELTGAVWDGAVAAIASDRRPSADEVRALADRAPLTAENARNAGLIDALGYRDEVLADIRARAARGAGGTMPIGSGAAGGGDRSSGGDEGGDGPAAEIPLLFADRWTPRRRLRVRRPGRRGVVGVVEAHGAIGSGRSRPGAGPTGGRVGSDTVCAALRAARDDDAVRAVVFRIDSPGGSAVASDVIWREVVRLREAGKPVVVSMGALAASGGYYIAAPADVIVAEPATLTGSIGVFGGKVVVNDLLERLGLTTGAVEHGAAARMYSPRRTFTDSETERLDRMLDDVYADFVGKVAQGRSMSYDDAERLARGRVWAGIEAQRNGLVDELGGRRDAVRIARERAGLPDDAPARAALHVPPLARLGRPSSSEDPRAVATSLGIPGLGSLGHLGNIGDLGDLLAAAGLPAPGMLLMPDIRLR